MSATLFLVARTVHFLGFSTFVGAAIASRVVLRAAMRESGERQIVLETVLERIISKVELYALLLAMIGGVLLLVANPAALNPATSGAGPWMHVKLAIVLLPLTGITHMRSSNAKRLVRARAAGHLDECAMRLSKARVFDAIELATILLVFGVALFRYAIFG